MERLRRLTAFVLPLALAAAGAASANTLESDIQPLLEGSCLACHGEKTSTPLNLTQLDFDLSDRATFKRWQRIFDRVEAGEMPPRASMLPDEAIVEAAMGALRDGLVEANLEERGEQRTPLRRLTRLEYQYAIQDLLRLDEEEAKVIAETLPAEADAGGFDMVAEKQGISPLHVKSYLAAADLALDAAIRLGEEPERKTTRFNYKESGAVRSIEHGEFFGAGIIKTNEDAVVIFLDAGATYTVHTTTEGWHVPSPGRYNVELEVYPYQPKSPIVLTLFRGVMSGSSAALNDLLLTQDLVEPDPVKVNVTTYLKPGHLISPSLAEADNPGDFTNYYEAENTVHTYKGEGIAIKYLQVEGPIHEIWPPESTREVLAGVEFSEAGLVELSLEPYEHIKAIVGRLAPRAFRRPLDEGELEAYASLAQPMLDDGLPLEQAIRVPLRAILTAPQFLFHAGDPGQLDDFSLATRLASFLWRSVPDDELLQVASEGRLTDPAVLRAQTERLLDDPKSERFVTDFVGQAFRLRELLSTTPDPTLYSTYDGRLAQAMGAETRLFVGELFRENLGVGNLIDSDFTFANRQLAEHYGIDGVTGTHMRKIAIPEGSPRGGLLTHASIHKITANGTTTSPIPRGNFVLDNLLGQPAPPPPAGVEGLEPDTRGATTIREQLAKHRNDVVCNSCHRKIDPPGFALEAFDPIGAFRENYRVLSKELTAPNGYTYRTPIQGPAVDPTGVTPQGESFQNIQEYKKLLAASSTGQVAHHMVSQLLTFSTGAEVEFADRSEVAKIAASLADDGYPMRNMIHEVVASDIFRRR